MVDVLLIIGIIVICFILLFIFCGIRLASSADCQELLYTKPSKK